MKVLLGPQELGSIADPSAAPKDAKPFSHPKYWADFILIGGPD